MRGGSIYILQREGPSDIHLYTIYMGRWYTVVLEEKLRKYGLEFKEVKSTTLEKCYAGETFDNAGFRLRVSSHLY